MEADAASPLRPGLGEGGIPGWHSCHSQWPGPASYRPCQVQVRGTDPTSEWSSVLPRAGSMEVAILGDDTEAPPPPLLHWHFLRLPPQSTKNLVLGSASREPNRRQLSIGF